MAVEHLITEHMETWTGAVREKKTAGRGSGGKRELYGIKKLRELILELAVRGLLVRQTAADGSSSELVARLSAAREEKIKNGQVKGVRLKKTPISDERLYREPENWVLTRLGNVFDVRDGTHDTPKYVPKGVPLITSKNLSEGFLNTNNTKFISQNDHELISQRSKVDRDDILFAMIGSIGNPVIVDVEPNFSIKNVALFKYYERKLSSPRFLLLYLDFAQIILRSRASGAVQSFVSLGALRNFVIALPPLAEQHRIVAKVDELMALCDQLEQQQENSLNAHQALVQTLLGALTTATEREGFNTAWARIADHFHTLFTTPDSIQQLRQTLLQLAVMGKLVPQDPDDEPLSVLLGRIISHQNQRYKRKEIQKPKTLIVDHSIKEIFPSSWGVKLVNDLAFVTKLAGFEYSKHIDLQDSGEIPVIRAQNVRPFSADLRNLKYIDAKTSDHLFRSALDRPSLLITFIGAGIGDVCVFNEDRRYHLAPNVAKMEPYGELNIKFLNIFLTSPIGRRELFKSLKSTAQPSLSMTTIREIWVPIPPIEEQHRIVAQVDELMAVCDRLKSAIEAAQSTRVQLADIVARQNA